MIRAEELSGLITEAHNDQISLLTTVKKEVRESSVAVCRSRLLPTGEIKQESLCKEGSVQDCEALLTMKDNTVGDYVMMISVAVFIKLKNDKEISLTVTGTPLATNIQTRISAREGEDEIGGYADEAALEICPWPPFREAAHLLQELMHAYNHELRARIFFEEEQFKTALKAALTRRG